VALEIYSHAMAMLPAGVPVGENPLGEWFDTVMDVIAAALPTIGTALTPFFPPSGPIAAGAAAGAKAAKDWNKNNREAASRAKGTVKKSKPLPVPPVVKKSVTLTRPGPKQ